MYRAGEPAAMSHAALRDAMRGVAFTLPTPFTEDARTVAHGRLADNVASLSERGGELFVPNGNTGEYYSLSHEERIAVVETTVEAAGPDDTVVAGAGGSTKTATALLEAYEEAGADGAMVMYPSHTYVHVDGLVDYYERLAEATDLPLVLYKRGDEVDRGVLDALSDLDSYVACKWAVDDVEGFAATVEYVDGDLVWLDGIAERFAPAFALEGAEGITTGIGNFVPERSLALQEALEARDFERARAIRNELRPLEELRAEPGAGNHVDSGNNVPVVKHCMDRAGFYGGPVREPLVALAEEDAARADELYDRVAGD